MAVLAGARRKAAIQGLAASNPALHAAYETALHAQEVTNAFVRGSGRFDLTAKGKLNTYPLFAELFARLARPGGRAGMIAPTGIATDSSTATFFSALVDGRRLVRLLDFENRAGLFPAVDSRMKFSLITLRGGLDAGRTGRVEEGGDPEFAFFLTAPAQAEDARRRFSLSAEAIARINPNTRTAPVFRSQADAELTARMYARAPVLIADGRPDGNPWGVEFRQGLFNMTSDSGLFRTAAQLRTQGWERDGVDWVPGGQRPRQGALAVEGMGAGLLPLAGGGPGRERMVPLYEAKMVHHYDHRWAGYAGVAVDARARPHSEDEEDEEEGPAARGATLAQKADSSWEPEPRYWVPEAEVEERLRAKGWARGWLLGWRDITNATNERTVIAAAFPRVGVGNNLPLMFFGPDRTPEQLAGLLANLSALPFDYAARHKVGGTHLNFFIYQQLPVLPPSFYTPTRLAFVVPRVLELAHTSHAMDPFARDLGRNDGPYPWDEPRRAQLRAELDAFYARAYGLSRDDLRHVLDPAEARGADYPSETFRVLKANEERLHGEYRTRRLVLAAWDGLDWEGL